MSVQCEIVCENLISLHRCKKILRGKYVCVHICFCVHILLGTMLLHTCASDGYSPCSSFIDSMGSIGFLSQESE
jgi:hypothetical protein